VKPRLGVPEDLRAMLLEFTTNFLLDQPVETEIAKYAAGYFNDLASQKTKLIDAQQSIDVQDEAADENTLSSRESYSGTCASGKFQSPINIQTELLINTKVPALQWSPGYFNLPGAMYLQANDHTVMITVEDPDPPELSIIGGPLQEHYFLQQVHFHWGQNNKVGAEHKFDGITYVMEIHAVHTIRNLSVSEASKVENGIAVVAYFVKIHEDDKDELSLALSTIADILPSLPPEDRNLNKLDTMFPMADLLPPRTINYVFYTGSLTTPPCSEVVNWIIFTKPMGILPEALANFRNLKAQQVIKKSNNWRDVKPLNGRKLYWACEGDYDEWEYYNWGPEENEVEI